MYFPRHAKPNLRHFQVDLNYKLVFVNHSIGFALLFKPFFVFLSDFALTIGDYYSKKMLF
jgi:hypothetical protein